jgi:hypothetical protein
MEVIMALRIPFSLTYFPLGKYITPETKPHIDSRLLTETEPLLATTAIEAAPPALSPAERKALEDKISKLDAAMYYDQYAIGITLAALKGLKEANLISGTAGHIIDWCVYFFPLALGGVNGILKGVRDNAAKELSPSPKPS